MTYGSKPYIRIKEASELYAEQQLRVCWERPDVFGSDRFKLVYNCSEGLHCCENLAAVKSCGFFAVAAIFYLNKLVVESVGCFKNTVCKAGSLVCKSLFRVKAYAERFLDSY